MRQLTMNVPAVAHGPDPAPDRSELERIAMAALEVGRLLMETGARAEIVHEDCLLAEVRNGMNVKRPNSFGISSGCCKVCTTF